MGIIGALIRRMARTRADPALPVLPEPRVGYALITSDMLHFEVLDGEEECGGVQLRANSDGDPTPWMVHVYGIDVNFATLGKARSWLRKPKITMDPRV